MLAGGFGEAENERRWEETLLHGVGQGQCEDALTQPWLRALLKLFLSGGPVGLESRGQ